MICSKNLLVLRVDKIPNYAPNITFYRLNIKYGLKY